MVGETKSLGIPAYVGTYNRLFSDLQNGVFAEGEKLPGEVALAKQYGVSRNTLRQALAILAEDGLITRSQGKMTTVSVKKSFAPLDVVSNPLEHLCKKEIDEHACDFNYGAPTEIAKDALALDKGDVVLAGNCVYLSKGRPVGFSFIQVPIMNLNALGVDVSDPHSIEELFTKTVFMAAQERCVTIKLVHANQSESELLCVAEQTELLLFEGIFAGATPKTLARVKLYVIPEYYELTFRI